MLPGSNLVERPSVSENDKSIYAPECGKVGCKPPFEAVIVNHLAQMRLRVIWDPRGLAGGIGVRCLVVLAINESCGLLVTARQWATDPREYAIGQISRSIDWS